MTANITSEIKAHFPFVTDHQLQQFEQLKGLYEIWNAQINVISRKDLEEFNERHLLHSLGLAKVMLFEAGSSVLDIGTGGGFPGIPLAILFPEVQFHLVDSIGKKIKVVQEVAQALGLDNVRATHARAENIHEEFDFIVSRAVTAMPAFLPWCKGKFKKEQRHEFRNGILYLKGGDLTEEMAPVKHRWQRYDLKDWFTDPFFETKAVIYVAMT